MLQLFLTFSSFFGSCIPYFCSTYKCLDLSINRVPRGLAECSSPRTRGILLTWRAGPTHHWVPKLLNVSGTSIDFSSQQYPSEFPLLSSGCWFLPLGGLISLMSEEPDLFASPLWVSLSFIPSPLISQASVMLTGGSHHSQAPRNAFLQGKGVTLPHLIIYYFIYIFSHKDAPNTLTYQNNLIIQRSNTII